MTDQGATPRPCNWRDGADCSISPVSVFEGRSYCAFHLPLDAPEKAKVAKVTKYQDLLGKPGNRHVEGVQFPSGKYEFPVHGLGVEIERCVFANDVTLELGNDNYTFSNTRFLGTVAVLNDTSTPSVSFTRVEFLGPTTVTKTVNGKCARSWKIEHSVFHRELHVAGVEFKDSLSLDNSTFKAPVYFEGAKFPQQTTAHRIRLEGTAISKVCEGSYRAARVEFSQHRNRDLEGLFYAYEKRCQRKGLKTAQVTCWANWLYDKASEYGQNYVRAFTLFVCLQLLAFAAYAYHFREISSKTFAFTTAQLVKPFDLLSLKPSAGGMYSDLFTSTPPTGCLLAAAGIHSILSVTMLAIFLLALRWRFKRE